MAVAPSWSLAYPGPGVPLFFPARVNVLVEQLRARWRGSPALLPSLGPVLVPNSFQGIQVSTCSDSRFSEGNGGSVAGTGGKGSPLPSWRHYFPHLATVRPWPPSQSESFLMLQQKLLDSVVAGAEDPGLRVPHLRLSRLGRVHGESEGVLERNALRG